MLDAAGYAVSVDSDDGAPALQHAPPHTIGDLTCHRRTLLLNGDTSYRYGGLPILRGMVARWQTLAGTA